MLKGDVGFLFLRRFFLPLLNIRSELRIIGHSHSVALWSHV